jgi:hypothetical protein
MNDTNSILRFSLRDLEETISDFRQAPYQSSGSLLARLVHHIDEEPMAGFLSTTLPSRNFDEWFANAQRTVGSMVGSGSLDWPVDRAQRIALQIALCRAIAASTVDLLTFVLHFYYTGNNLSANVNSFASHVLDPMLRDIRHLTESRPVAPVLFEAMGKLPASGDALLDALIADACTKFKDPAPKARQEATEKLWDAWERLKSLEISEDKRLSVGRLLDYASSESTFRALLQGEAKALSDIGNNFHIRHFETNRVSLSQPEQFDYLFHRLYALMHLLLFNRQRSRNDI